MEKRISGKTRLIALIGSPVEHSGSPALYNFGFAHHGLDYAYLAFDIKVDQVPEAIKAARLLNMRGFNVTMPCKNEVAKYMDELSPAARIIGAVNTVVNENGKLVGHITDGPGFVRNLKEHGVGVENKKLVVLGAGGAATAIQVECALSGAKEVTIFNMSDEFFTRAEETAKKIENEAPGCKVKVCPLEDRSLLAEEIAKADIVVNGTVAGMKPNEDVSLVDKEMFINMPVVVDVVYDPKKTRMMREAEEIGCVVIGGEGMLLWQGVEAYKLYTGLDMPVEEYRRFQSEQQNK
ncbi:shikimate dehydrogenase [Alkalibacter mobilis]|uniref:shikimate dehydrogenase n=1 Tax=Alkalibacter mobilis TaxID=2787712 RepID=UPI00189D654D|nr:shikimate dehydrogenase [Alkalibacter mobilis]MBF7096441.1 shikimate dehydrogenase [Alkalibacter mobilis]